MTASKVTRSQRQSQPWDSFCDWQIHTVLVSVQGCLHPWGNRGEAVVQVTKVSDEIQVCAKPLGAMGATEGAAQGLLGRAGRR